MKAADIVALKQMSEEVCRAIPQGLMMDGKGDIYCNGHVLPKADLLCDIDRASTAMQRLDKVIQGLEGRKSSK